MLFLVAMEQFEKLNWTSGFKTFKENEVEHALYYIYGLPSLK